MLVEFSIVPLGLGEHLTDALSEVLEIVDKSGVRYRLAPAGTCLEGTWDEVMGVIRDCHDALRRKSPHVMTNVSIEDEEGARDKLQSNVSTLQIALGRRLEHLGPSGHLAP